MEACEISHIIRLKLYGAINVLMDARNKSTLCCFVVLVIANIKICLRKLKRFPPNDFKQQKLRWSWNTLCSYYWMQQKFRDVCATFKMVFATMLQFYYTFHLWTSFEETRKILIIKTSRQIFILLAHHKPWRLSGRNKSRKLWRKLFYIRSQH